MPDIVYQALWDCTCGEIQIPGLTKVCPRCEEPHNPVLNPSTAWYLPDEKKIITDPEQIRKSELPAWNCGRCGTENDGELKVCTLCGRPLDHDDTVNRTITYGGNDATGYDSKPDRQAEIVEGTLDEAERVVTGELKTPRKMRDLKLPESDLPTTGEDTAFYQRMRKEADARFKERERLSALPPIRRVFASHRRGFILSGIGALVAVIIALVIFVVVPAVRAGTATEPGTVTVTELHWERKVEIEKLKTFSEDGWTYPTDARIVSSTSKVRSHRKVHDGWKDEEYTDYETRYKDEEYEATETRWKDVPYQYDCKDGPLKDNGNGTYTQPMKKCDGIKQKSYEVKVKKTRQVAYKVSVKKTRQVEITHQEPIYATWYSYQVDRWTSVRWVSASDTTSTFVAWPEVTNLVRNIQPGDQVGEEHVGPRRSANYSFVYVDKRGVRHNEASGNDALWSKLAQNEVVPALYRKKSGNLVSVNWDAVS